MGGTGSVLARFSASVGSGAGGSSMVTSGAGVASGTSACSSSAIMGTDSSFVCGNIGCKVVTAGVWIGVGDC